MNTVLIMVFQLYFCISLAKSLLTEDPCESCLILTGHIKNGHATLARTFSEVNSASFLGIRSFSGFLTVKEQYDSNLFFWFFPKADMENTPWIIWLQGGPGASSLMGVFDLIGPIQIVDGKVTARNVTWAEDYSLLFIDNPVGAGFSFTGDERGYPDNEQDVGCQLLELLQQFLEMFPELRQAPLFIAGESYAGKYVPALGIQIHRHWHTGSINFKGIMIGNGLIDPRSMMHYSELCRVLGLLDNDQINRVKALEHSVVHLIDHKNWTMASKAFNKTIEYIKKHSGVSIYNYLRNPDSTAAEFEAFLERPDVRECLHVGNASFDYNNQLVYEKMLPDIMNTTKPWLEELLEYYGVMCYSGQLDVILAYSLSKYTYDALRWSRREEYENAQRVYLRRTAKSPIIGCAQNILGAHQNKLKYLSNGDPYRKLLERTYVSGYEGAPADGAACGEPLLLTPFIEQNKTGEARRAAYVDSKHFVPGVDSYAGYLTVDKEYNSNLFFWYFPVMKKPVNETPLILWLQGGPGCSSLYGLFEEIGPYTVTKDLKIQEKKHSWSKEHSLLFIDNPVGTGFSFTDSDDGYSTNQTTIGENLYKALQQFFDIFPELRKAPLIIAGESYAGKHVPSIGIQILWHKDQDPPINLQGLAIGNGFIDPVTLQSFSDVGREMGIIDDWEADDLKEIEDKVVKCIEENKIREAFYYQITAMDELEYTTRLPNPYNILSDKADLFGSYVKFVQQPAIRRALHVGNTSYDNVGKVYGMLVPDIMNSAKSWLEELLDHYRVMVYNGHLDTVVAYHPSVNTYKSLSFSDAEKYKNAKREIWKIKNSVAGYFKKAGNFLEVMVRNAGHMVPVDQPAAALTLITAFARDGSLDTQPIQS